MSTSLPFLLLSIPLCGSWFPLVPFSFCLKHCEHLLRCRSPGASVCLTKLPCTIVGRAYAEFGIAGCGPSSTALRRCALPSSLVAPAVGLLPSLRASPPDQSPLAALECLLTTDLQLLGHDALGVLCPLGFVGYGLPQMWIFSAIISAMFFVSPQPMTPRTCLILSHRSLVPFTFRSPSSLFQTVCVRQSAWGQSQ